MTEIVVPVIPLGAAAEVAVGVEQGAIYELVGPDGTRAVFNNRDDVDFVGWLTAPPSGLDSPEVRESADLLVEADGGIHGAFYFGRRPFTLEGIIDPTPDADAAVSYAAVADTVVNLIPNPGFESGSTTGSPLAANYGAVAGPTISASSERVYRGLFAGKIVAAGAGYLGAYSAALIGPVPGDAISLSAKVYATRATTYAHLTAFYYNFAGSYITEHHGTDINLTQDAWTDLTQGFTAPAGTAMVAFGLQISATGTAIATGNTFYLDDYRAAVGSGQYDYVDANTDPTIGDDLTATLWAGAPNNSPSIRRSYRTISGYAGTDVVDTEAAVVTNLLYNPSGESGSAANWGADSSSGAFTPSPVLAPRTGSTGRYSIGVTTGATSIAAGGYLALASNPTVAVTPGETIFARGWAVAITNVSQFQFLVEFFTAAGAYISGAAAQPIRPQPGYQWTEFLGNVVAPATAGAMRLFVQAYPAAAGPMDIRIDELVLAKYSGTVPYFDGDTPGPTGYPTRSRYNGVVGSSSSTLYDVNRRAMQAGEVANKRVNRLQRATRAMSGDAILKWQAANGPAVQLSGRRQQPLRITDRLPKKFLAALVAAEPRILRQVVSTVAGTLNGANVTARNDGNAPTPPVVTIRATGTVATPLRVRNYGTGEYVELALTLAAADVVVVDFRARTVTLNGANRYDAVAFTASAWWDLQPGDNPVTVEGGSALATFEVAWRDAWL